MSKADEAIEKAISSKVNHYLLRFFRFTTTICITATIALLSFLYSFGNHLYEHSDATKAAIDTFIQVKKNGSF